MGQAPHAAALQSAAPSVAEYSAVVSFGLWQLAYMLCMASVNLSVDPVTQASAAPLESDHRDH